MDGPRSAVQFPRPGVETLENLPALLTVCCIDYVCPERPGSPSSCSPGDRRPGGINLFADNPVQGEPARLSGRDNDVQELLRFPALSFTCG